MAMFKTPRGAKLKVKGTSTLFNHTIVETKEGFYTLSKVFSSKAEAEDAVVDHVAAVNTRESTWAYRRRNCLPRCAAHEMRVGRLARDPGVAVAVRLDSIGKEVDYYSFDSWERNGFVFPKGYKAFWS